MSTLKVQRCFNHRQREAVARCATCGNYFCRECVTEHAGRMTCARCLVQPAVIKPRLQIVPLLTGTLLLGVGLVILWFCFFLAGRVLLAIPTAVHEGTIWSFLWALLR